MSLLKLNDGIFKVVGTSGDVNLGGDDFDYLFAQKILKKEFSLSLNTLNKAEKVNFIKKCRSFKEKILTHDSFSEIILVKNIKKNVLINSDLLNSSIDELIEKTLTIIIKLINECKIELSNINGIILVGGSSRLKLIREKLKKKT